MKPVMQVREMTTRVIGMLRIIQTSLTTYFKGENDEMVAVEGPVKFMIQVNKPIPPPKELVPEEPVNDNFLKWENEDDLKAPRKEQPFENNPFSIIFKNENEEKLENEEIVPEQKSSPSFAVENFLQDSVLKGKRDY